MRIVLARARRELPTGTTLERAREAPAGRTQATEVGRKSAAVVFAGLDRGAPLWLSELLHSFHFTPQCGSTLFIDCSVVTSFALLVWPVPKISQRQLRGSDSPATT